MAENTSPAGLTTATPTGSALDRFGQLSNILTGVSKTVLDYNIQKDALKAAAKQNTAPAINPTPSEGISTRTILIGAGILVGVVIVGAVMIRMSK